MTSRTDSNPHRAVQPPVLREEDLLRIFVSRGPVCERVGLELEKFGVLPDGRSLPVEGPRSVRVILERLERERGWAAERDGEWIIALRRGDQMISVEPGGQLELSTAPACLLDDAYRAEREHLRELEEITGGWGVIWCGAGVRPMDSLDSIGWIPKRRYTVMRDYLAGTGDLAHWMMKMTASLQVSVDYVSEADAALKLGVLARLTPILTAVCAASPIVTGRASGYQSYRSHIWTRTDPARCGLPDCFFKRDFRFGDYVEYALSVPLFFIEREGELLPTGALTFREFMRAGYRGQPALPEDWNRHLTFLFPEIRLKSYIEIRSCDRQPGTLSFGTAALIKGLVYDPAALRQADAWLRTLGADETRAGLREAARNGLEGRYGDRALRDWVVEALALGRDGLKRLRSAGRASESELAWFAALEAQIVQNAPSLAAKMLRALSAGENLEPLIRL